jgi:hypothetical protein
MRKLPVILTAAAAGALFTLPALAELGSNIPTDAALLTQREVEAGCDTSTTLPTCPSGTANVFNSGTFDIGSPPTGTTFAPVKRVRRDKFGVVGPFMLNNGLTATDLDNLVYPDATSAEKNALVEGLQFFTMFHTATQGLGPLNNQPACIGCHLNAAEAVKSKGLLHGQDCLPPNLNSTCSNVSNVTRAARSTPTNFEFASLDPNTGGGRAPDNLDALTNTGRTAAFTTFGDFDPNHADADSNPTGIGFFDPLDGTTLNIVSGATAQPFGGFVQHHRPAGPDCLTKPLPPLSADDNLPNGNSGNPNNFHRSVGERAGPPYIGRGLMEAVPTADITANAGGVQNGQSSLGNFAVALQCPAAGCISGKANMIPRNLTVHTATTDLQNGTVTGFVGGVGRFGLRANGVEILQFIVGGLQGELSFTSLLNGAEIVFPTLFPGGTTEITEPSECALALSQTFGQPASVLPPPPFPPPGPVNLDTLEVHLSTPFSIRNLLRNTAPPEFGDALLDVLQSRDPGKPLHGNSKAAMVQRGAQLFGIDVVAFANRTVGGAMKAGGDGRDDNAINQADRKLNCVGCHIPVSKTGQSPADVGAEHLTNVWAPIFSDLLLHHMPVINGERTTTDGLPRNVAAISRLAANASHKGDDGAEGEDCEDDPGRAKGRVFDTFDLERNLADDTFSNAKASAEGSEFRTPPLMGLGRIGTPFLHDGRVYLSRDTVQSTPAGTVTTNRDLTNAPLVIHSLDDALLASIELHDLPAPDDGKTPKTPGAGCPVPQETTNVIETAADICPAYSSTTSQTNRSDSREVILRFRELSAEDQRAVIEFLKQL